MPLLWELLQFNFFLGESHDKLIFRSILADPEQHGTSGFKLPKVCRQEYSIC